MPSRRLLHVSAIGATAYHLLLPQAIAAKAEGYEVAFAYTPDANVTHYLTGLGFRVFESPISRSIRPTSDWHSCVRLSSVLNEWQPCIVHTHTSKGGAVGRIAARLARVGKVVHTVHGFPFVPGQNPLAYHTYVALEWTLARCTDMLLSQSQEDCILAQRHGIRARGGYPRWIGNGVNLERFARSRSCSHPKIRTSYGLGESDVMILTVARITREKGLLELLEALSKHRNRPWHWFIVGGVESEQYDQRFRSRIAELGLTTRVHLLGTRQDIVELMHEADWFALTSYREGVPRSMIEAHAMGLPCITTNVRGCREVTIHDETGYVVPLHDPSKLTAAVGNALSIHVDQYQLMSKNAQDRAVKCFDENRVIARILSAYQDVLTH